MDWITKFQLFLFDFDGLLVNTEHLHFAAYCQMLERRGYKVDWSFRQFCQLAHLNSESLRERIYQDFPDIEPDFRILYAEKKAIYQELIANGKLSLMPGSEALLLELQKKDIRRCVVTNSPLEQISLIRSKIPALQTIPHWITREDYSKAKPDPECYLKAISLYGKSGDKIIGFEDSIRGLKALQNTPALPCLVCPDDHPLLEMALSPSVAHFTSLDLVRF